MNPVPGLTLWALSWLPPFGGELPIAVVRHPRGVHDVTFAGDGRWLLSVSADGVVQLSDPTTGQLLRRNDCSSPPCAAAVSAARITVAYGEAGLMNLRAVRGGRSTSFSHALGPMDALGLSSDARVLVSIHKGSPAIWDMDVLERKPVAFDQVALGAHARPLFDLSPDGTRLALSAVGESRCWCGLLDETPVPWFPCPPITALALALDGTLATGHVDRKVRLWVGPKEVVCFAALPAAPARLAWAPDGQALAVACSGEPVVRLLEVRTGREGRRLFGPIGAVTDLAYSPDGDLVAAGNANGVVAVWDVSRSRTPGRAPAAPTGQELRNLWTELVTGSPDESVRAYRALRAWERPATELLRKELQSQAMSADDATRIAQWISDLDARRFTRREQATAALARVGDRARPALEHALHGWTSPEARRRLEDLLVRIEDGRALSPEATRVLPALDLLEAIGTNEARAVLEWLTREAAETALRREAQTVLDRFVWRPGR